MSQRIQQLEDGLEISHSANSTSAHPLLREELRSIKKGVGPSPSAVPDPDQDAGETGEGVEEAMGTMTISDRGVSRFIGRSGGGESLLMVRITLNSHVLIRDDKHFLGVN